MGRAARLNPIAIAAKAGEVKPAKPESLAQQRDRLRTTMPDYTRLGMLRYLGITSGVLVASKGVGAKVTPKRKVTITRIEE